MSSLGGMVDAVEEAELELHGVLYSVSVLVHGEELLVVKIEDRDTLDAWHGEFAAKYVEDITGKTGSFKKFGVFVRMLTSAVLQQSDSVFVDLLTCADLELLKAKKAAAAAAGAADQSDAGQQQQQQLRQLPPSLANKRYLILTYASEFDRVHYPLPLLADEQPDPARFKAVIASLRQQLADVTAGLALQQQHRQPPQAGGQQQQLLLGSGRGRGWSGAGGQAEADAALLSSRLEVAQAELEGQAAAHRREMRKKAREVQELHEELSRSRDVTRELRLRVTKLEVELEAARSSLAAAAGAGGAGAGRGGSKGGYRRPAAADRYTYGGGTSSSYLAGSSKFPSRPHQQQQQYGGPPLSSSRNSSRGSSPASSRGRSPSYARPWAQGSPVSRPPRPSSAPPKQRFDPTEYVRQKREREQQRLASAWRSTPVGGGGGGSRGGSPAHSVRSSRGGGDQPGASTPRSTAALSHASSFERKSNSSIQGDRGLQQPGAAATRGGGRAGSSGGRASQQHQQQQQQRRPGSSSGGGAGYGYYDVGRPGSAGRLLLQQQRPGSSGSAASRDQLGAIYGVPAAGAGGARGGGAAAAAAAAAGGSRPSSRPGSRSRLGRDTAPGRDGPGVASPGRALQGVRDKLDAYYAKQQQQGRLAAGVVHTTVQPSSPADPPYKAAAAAAAPSPRQQQLQRVPVVAAAAGGPSPAKAAAAAALGDGSGVGGGVFQDASSEIADIDQRLHALQNFLKKAKSSVGGA